MTKLSEHEKRISVLEAQMARLLDGRAQTEDFETEQPITLNARPKQQIQTRGKILWVRRADEDLALSNGEWDSLRAGDNDE